MNITMNPCLGCAKAAGKTDGTECAIHGPAAQAARTEECSSETARNPAGQIQIALTEMREASNAARAEVKRLEQRASAAEAEVARLHNALGMDSPWPVHDVLARLADATDLLLTEHNFDGHGHEEIRYARDAARRIVAALTVRRRVVSAIIIEPGPDQQKPLILLAQRKWNQSYPGQWESPGGKVEDGETDEEAMIREVREELGCACKVVHGVASVDLDPPQVLRSLTLTFYRVVLLGKPEPLASDGLRYVSAEEMQQLDLMPANRVLMAHVLAEMALRPGLGR